MIHTIEEVDIFKQCTMCESLWYSRESFLTDNAVLLTGYQVNFEELLAGFFLFTHSCGTTFAIPAESFEDLYLGEIFETRKTGSAACPRYCLRQDETAPCPARCECAYVREIMQVIKQWPKSGSFI